MKIDDVAPKVLIIRDLREILRALSGPLLSELAKDSCVSSENNRGSWTRGSGQILSVDVVVVDVGIKDITFWSPVFGAGRVLYPV